MTEADWLSGVDPDPMLSAIREKVSRRKLRLFSCACCRRIWHLLIDRRSRGAVEAAERLSDRTIEHRDVVRARQDARAAWKHLYAEDAHFSFQIAAEAASRAIRSFKASETPLASCDNAVDAVIYEEIPDYDINDGDSYGPPSRIRDRERRAQAALLRDIVGNPFRPHTIEMPCVVMNGSEIVKLAQSIYDERRFQNLPALADALEKAGCNDEEMLGHCRSATPHVPGCWVVDLLIGKR